MLPTDTQPRAKVPLFPSWSYWYALVIGLLIALTLLFFLITKRFA